MTDKEVFLNHWGFSGEEGERLWTLKLERERNPLRSAGVYVMQAYQSPVTDKWIDTPAQRRDDLARTGSRPWEGMAAEKAEATRRADYEDKAFDKVAEKAAVESFKQLPEEHKRALS